MTVNTKVHTLTSTILKKMPELSKWEEDFLLELFELHCRLRGRYNFKNMSRQSDLNEGTFHNNYKKDFDFAKFNEFLCDQYLGTERIVALDPSYISKSGKHTPGSGYFWSGCAGKISRGLEIAGFSTIGILDNTAMHMVADQTLHEKEYSSLLDYYAALVAYEAPHIRRQSNYLVVDAFFSREPFVSQVSTLDIELISRLRKDANLSYPYVGLHPKHQGPKRKYAGKFDPKELDMSYFSCCIDDKKENFKLYEATLYSYALKRSIRVAVKHNLKEDGTIKNYQIFFSTDLTISGIDIYCYYKARYQIEFLFRDAKQYLGLEHCQSRNEDKLHFHFNIALTVVSVAKAIYHLSQPLESRNPFSMADIKTQYFNEYFFDLIIQQCGISPNDALIIPIREKFSRLGKIRA